MQLLAQIRANILKGFESFPILIGSFIGFIAVGLGNMGLFLLFVGQFFIVPFIIRAMNGVSGTAQVSNASQIGLEPGVDFTASSQSFFSNINSYSYPSYWIGQLWFLVGYTLSNAVDLYTAPIESRTEDWRKIARQSKTGTLIATILILGSVLTILRYLSSGTENAFGIFVGVLSMGLAGFAWYEFAKLCGTRMSDIFGIATQTLNGGKSSQIMTCAYPSVSSSTK
jgi:hypothetical protein